MPLLLDQIDHYLDVVPRPASRAEVVGPFTVFHAIPGGWNYYARPTPGFDRRPTNEDVEAACEAQGASGAPHEFEWIHDLHPDLAALLADCGFTMHAHPLLAARADEIRSCAPPDGFRVQFVEAHDLRNRALATAVAQLGFAVPGTGVGDAGLDDLQAAASAAPTTAHDAFRTERLQTARTVTAIVIDEHSGLPVCQGSHQPMAGTTEIVGVATLPSFRRRGLGAALTSALATDARERDVELVVLSAGDDDVARIYERLGFHRVGTVGAADRG